MLNKYNEVRKKYFATQALLFLQIQTKTLWPPSIENIEHVREMYFASVDTIFFLLHVYRDQFQWDCSPVIEALGRRSKRLIELSASILMDMSILFRNSPQAWIHKFRAYESVEHIQLIYEIWKWLFILQLFFYKGIVQLCGKNCQRPNPDISLSVLCFSQGAKLKVPGLVISF